MHTLLDLIRSGHYWRYCIDGPDHARGPAAYEDECGYLPAMLNGMVYANDLAHKTEDLTVDDIEGLLKACISGVEATNFDKIGVRDFTCTSQSLRYQQERQFTSAAGLDYILSKIHAEETPYLGFTNLTEQVLCGHDDGPDADEAIRQRFQEENSFFFHRFAADTHKELETLLQRYHAAIKAAADDTDQRLLAIAHFCIDAIQLHPFLDGNGRVFCMLMPYLLCQRNGLSIPFMENVNIVQGNSPDEVAAALEQGFEYTKNLVQTHKLPVSCSWFHLEPNAAERRAFQDAEKSAAMSIAKASGSAVRVLDVACQYHEHTEIQNFLEMDRALGSDEQITLWQTILQYKNHTAAKMLIEADLFTIDRVESDLHFLNVIEAIDGDNEVPLESLPYLGHEAYFQCLAHSVTCHNHTAFANLLEHRPDEFNLNQKDAMDASLLSIAIKHNNQKALKALIAHGADINNTVQGIAMTEAAARLGHQEAFMMLYQAEGNTYKPNKAHEGLVRCAVDCETPTLLAQLAELKPKLFQQKIAEIALFLYAIRHQKAAAISVCLTSGLSIDKMLETMEQERRTDCLAKLEALDDQAALVTAIEKGYMQCTQALIAKMGLDLTNLAADSPIRAAYFTAVRSENVRMLQLLWSHGLAVQVTEDSDDNAEAILNHLALNNPEKCQQHLLANVDNDALLRQCNAIFRRRGHTQMRDFLSVLAPHIHTGQAEKLFADTSTTPTDKLKQLTMVGVRKLQSPPLTSTQQRQLVDHINTDATFRSQLARVCVYLIAAESEKDGDRKDGFTAATECFKAFIAEGTGAPGKTDPADLDASEQYGATFTEVSYMPILSLLNSKLRRTIAAKSDADLVKYCQEVDITPDAVLRGAASGDGGLAF